MIFASSPDTVMEDKDLECCNILFCLVCFYEKTRKELNINEEQMKKKQGDASLFFCVKKKIILCKKNSRAVSSNPGERKHTRSLQKTISMNKKKVTRLGLLYIY